jgi:hypothetical protein
MRIRAETNNGGAGRGLILGTGTRERSGDPTTGGQANQRQWWHSARRARSQHTAEQSRGAVQREGGQRMVWW